MTIRVTFLNGDTADFANQIHNARGIVPLQEANLDPRKVFKVSLDYDANELARNYFTGYPCNLYDRGRRGTGVYVNHVFGDWAKMIVSNWRFG